MSTIINSAWKGKKEGDEVTYKNETYTIGSDAFGSVEAAADAGQTDDLVILDKKLTSPVTVSGEKVYITSAATDIFQSVAPDPVESADGKTTTTTITFNGASAGTATVTEQDAALVGFEKVTANKAGEITALGGKLDIAYSRKEFTDSDKGVTTINETASVSSVATGALSVTGVSFEEQAEVTVGSIYDSEEKTEAVFEAIADVYGRFDDDDYEFKPASYASVTLKNEHSVSGFNGGSVVEKTVFNSSNTNDQNITEEASYTYSFKTGAGTADLKDAGAGELNGYKTVKLTITNPAMADLTVGDVKGGNVDESYSAKTTYVEDTSSTYNYAHSEATTLAGTLTATGKAGTGGAEDQIVFMSEIKRLSSATLKYAHVGDGDDDGEVKMVEGNKKSSLDISVKKQNEVDALTANFSFTAASKAAGTLTATNSEIEQAITGAKTATLTDTAFSSADATDSNSSITKKETGTALGGISADPGEDYAAVFNGGTSSLDTDLVDETAAYTVNYTRKDVSSVGGTKFTFSGKTAEFEDAVAIAGYQTVTLDNKNSESYLTAAISNDSSTMDETVTEAFTPESKYSYSSKWAETFKAEGTASLKGYTEASVSGFAKVKATGGATKETKLTGVWGQTNSTSSFDTAYDVTATAADPIAKYTHTVSESDRNVASLDANKATLSGMFSNLKTAKLTNVAIDGNAAFSVGGDYDEKSSTAISWKADDISAEAATDVPAWGDDTVTSWTETTTEKSTRVGDFTLKNDANNADIGGALSVDGFKNVTIDISSATAELAIEISSESDEDYSKNKSLAVTETSRSYSKTKSQTQTAVGALKVTGKSTTAAVTTVELDAASQINFATITLKDAILTGAGEANAFVEITKETENETATLDTGYAVAANYTLETSYSKAGNGKFTASVAKLIDNTPVTVFAGDLNGYGTISLNNVGIGNVNNYAIDGDAADEWAVPTEEYFGPMDEVPAGAETLNGNVKGSYVLTQNGQVTSTWTGSYATKASGSFTQTAKVDGVFAGDIIGYDKVDLTASTAGVIAGISNESATSLTYKYADDTVVTNSKVITEQWTSGSSVKLTGKKNGIAWISASAAAINGYQTVTLKHAEVAGDISAVSGIDVYSIDKVEDLATWTETTASVGSLTASDDSVIGGNISGFQTVKLTNTQLGEATVISGGAYSRTATIDAEAYPYEIIDVMAEQYQTAGAFTAEDNRKNPEERWTIAGITGYQKVTVTDYSVGEVIGQNSSMQVIPADDAKDIPTMVQESFSGKANSFTATAKKSEEMVVGDVKGYGKVEATGLVGIDSIFNGKLVLVDETVFYGEWSTSFNADAEEYTAISVDASSASVKVKGIAAKGATPERLTAMTGSIAGYGNVELANVVIGGGEEINYISGKYTYSTQVNADEEVIASVKDEAVGKLKISSAQTDGESTFNVLSFKDVDISFTDAAAINSIISGTTTSQVTDGNEDFTTFATTGKLNLVTVEGSVTGTVAGFTTVNFKNTSLAADAEVQGYAIDAKKNSDGDYEQKMVGKSTITFDNSTEAGTDVAGAIVNAKAIEFKASSNDDGEDFAITGVIDSVQSLGEEKVNTKITFTKCEASADLSQFFLDKGDVIELKSYAELTLTNVGESLEDYFAGMADSSLKGTGIVYCDGVTGDDIKAALTANNISYANTIAFNPAV